jgi:hypothetical protein
LKYKDIRSIKNIEIGSKEIGEFALKLLDKAGSTSKRRKY